MGNDNIITVVVLAAVAFFFFSFKKEGETARGKTAPIGEEKITQGCPQGQSFYKGITEAIFGCPPGYKSVGGWLGGIGGEGCQCKSAPTSIPDAANSPQTPAPEGPTPTQRMCEQAGYPPPCIPPTPAPPLPETFLPGGTLIGSPFDPCLQNPLAWECITRQR